jgi:hypothetical protein
LLNKLRNLLEPTLTKIGEGFASTGLSANFWTGLGLAISVLAAIVYASNAFLDFDWTPWNFAAVIGGIFLLISGFFDIVDGSVARITKQISKKGAFLDSVFDKIAEVIIFGGIALGQFADSFWCLVALLYESKGRIAWRETQRHWNRRACRTAAAYCDNRHDTCERSNAMGNDNCFYSSRYHVSSEGSDNCKETIFYLSLTAVRLSDSDLTFTTPL